MKPLLPHPIITPALTLVWLLLNNSFAPGHILLGLLLGWAIPHLTLAFWPDTVKVYKPSALLRLFGLFLYDILVANLVVARLILTGPKHLKPAFVAVSLDIDHPFAISLLANIISLTPGTVSAQLSDDRRSLWVHALDTDNPDALITEIKTRYEAPLKEAFTPC
ncbi:MAG: Na+/H+ antiporter subunit E [Gammaproteobacteria bacterium]|nr:Na+/H+ antiporter subunit E [Gammaproteobacteria bacterium]